MLSDIKVQRSFVTGSMGGLLQFKRISDDWEKNAIEMYKAGIKPKLNVYKDIDGNPLTLEEIIKIYSCQEEFDKFFGSNKGISDDRICDMHHVCNHDH